MDVIARKGKRFLVEKEFKLSIQDFSKSERKMLDELVLHSGFNQQEIMGLAIAHLYDSKPWPVDINLTAVKKVRNGLASRGAITLEAWCDYNGYSITMAKVCLDLIQTGDYPVRPRSRRLVEQLELDSGVPLTI
jgi:hypothetical protein